MSGDVPVLVEDTAQTGTSLNGSTGDLGLITSRRRQGARRRRVGDTLMRVLVENSVTGCELGFMLLIDTR